MNPERNAPQKFGVLYLIPTWLSAEGTLAEISKQNFEVCDALRHFVVENAKIARHFLKQIGIQSALQDLDMQVLSEHTGSSEIANLLAPLLAGHDLGLLSDAGCPCVADPGADLVRLAHQRGIKVRPLVGPSSILLTLMASGLEGQRFSFLGYVPQKDGERADFIRAAERRSAQQRETVLFMDVPYRSEKLRKELLAFCRPETLMTMGVALTQSNELIKTVSIAAWRNDKLKLEKVPVMFAILAKASAPVNK